MDKELDYLIVLKALEEIPFNIGRKLLIEFLQGRKSNESISRNRLDSKEHFGSLAYTKDELNAIIENLLLNGLIKAVSLNSNKFWKVLELTPKGRDEITSPSLYKRKLSFNFKNSKTLISEQDRILFKELDSFLNRFNDEQKKSIICRNKYILCIAGAGSGKTTVLTKRIEFLVKYLSVDPAKILAITFTRKARHEMMSRLDGLDLARVETFNSFCEKILKQYNNLVYDKQVRVITYRDKVIMMNKALSSLNLTMSKAIDLYFSYAQIRGKTPEQLANILLNDCFFIRDYFKFKNLPINRCSFDSDDVYHKKSADIVCSICSYIEEYMLKNGLRDFADQLVDAIGLFESHKELIPKFDHVLIDEYQDINSTQIKMIGLLASKNIFCVGDPRQSIYGWRGSDIKYILNFEDAYPDCEITTLTKNYRSTKHIVELINTSIKNMSLPDLAPSLEGDNDIRLLRFDSEDSEFEFVMQRIIASKLPGSEIFVLARTNRQLNDLSNLMTLRGIKHVVRSDEIKRSVAAKEEDVTLATIHAIKGLEADMVFVIGCTGINFPCKGSEHPVIDMVNLDEYDKEEEERRLFYVAMSRAKNTLYLTYSGRKPTYFLTPDMLKILEEKKIALEPAKIAVKALSGDIMTRLRDWRRELSKAMNIPAYIVMHDKTLIDIAQKSPASSAELEEIHGLGPTKIMKYGEDILRIVNGC